MPSPIGHNEDSSVILYLRGNSMWRGSQIRGPRRRVSSMSSSRLSWKKTSS
jgi:hypothetical protein